MIEIIAFARDPDQRQQSFSKSVDVRNVFGIGLFGLAAEHFPQRPSERNEPNLIGITLLLSRGIVIG